MGNDGLEVFFVQGIGRVCGMVGARSELSVPEGVGQTCTTFMGVVFGSGACHLGPLNVFPMLFGVFLVWAR